ANRRDQVQSIASARLFGRMSVQVLSMYSRQSGREASPKTTSQPWGTSTNVGHSEYWCSAFLNTMNGASSSSNGVVTGRSFARLLRAYTHRFAAVAGDSSLAVSTSSDFINVAGSQHEPADDLQAPK